jgi:hypothetical protein
MRGARKRADRRGARGEAVSSVVAGALDKLRCACGGRAGAAGVASAWVASVVGVDSAGGVVAADRSVGSLCSGCGWLWRAVDELWIPRGSGGTGGGNLEDRHVDAAGVERVIRRAAGAGESGELDHARVVSCDLDRRERVRRMVDAGGEEATVAMAGEQAVALGQEELERAGGRGVRRAGRAVGEAARGA